MSNALTYQPGPASDIRLYNEDYYVVPDKVSKEEVPEEAAPASWVEGLITKLKAGISTASSKVEVREYIPADEKELMERIEMEETGLEIFRNIFLNRQRLYEDALTLGMTPQEIRECGDFCLDPVITQTWKNRYRERAAIVSGLKMTLDTKRTQRLARR